MKTMKQVIPAAILIFIITSLLVTNSDVLFESGIQNQIEDHYGMNEIYVHYYAGTFNFIISAASALIIVAAENRVGIRGWTYIASGIFLNGLVGLGEVIEHFFNPFWHDFFHYVHIYAGLFGLFLLYLGTRSVVSSITGREVTEKTSTVLAALAALFLLSMLTSIKTTQKWDPTFEVPVISVLFIPTLLLTVLLVYDAAKIFQESGFVMVTLSAFAVFAMLLNLVIILGRISDVIGNAYAYILTHGIQDILHVASATTAFVFSVTLNITLRKLEKIEELML